MRNWLIFCYLLCLSSTSWAQTTTLKGIIIDKKTKKAVAGARVYIDAYASRASVSDVNGNFTLTIPEALASAEEIKIYIQPPGQEEIRIPRLVKPSGNIAQFPIYLPKKEITSETPSAENLPDQEPLNTDKMEETSPTEEEVSAQPSEVNQDQEQASETLVSSSADSSETLSKISALEHALSDLKNRLQQEKQAVMQRSEMIKEKISVISNQLRVNQEISPQERETLIERLEELEKQLQENVLAYQRLQQTAQDEINEIKELIGAKEFVIPWNVILFLLGIILVLTIIALVSFNIARRFRRQSRQLSQMLSKVNQQNEEINQQNHEINSQNEELAAQRDQLAELSDRLRLSLEEVHHRVKNHLQRTSSLLDLSMNQDRSLEQIVNDIRGRIYSMALIHKKLQNTERLDQVNLRDYIEELVHSVADTFRPPDKQITCHTSIAEVSLDISTSTDLGLIVNELVSNAYKYAFVDRTEGKIEVIIPNPQGEEYELIVKDNGVGLPSDLDIENADSLGLSLTHGLAERMEGKVKAESRLGTTFKVSFKNRYSLI